MDKNKNYQYPDELGNMSVDTTIKHTASGNVAKVQSSTFLGELGPSCPRPIKGEEFIKIKEKNVSTGG